MVSLAFSGKLTGVHMKEIHDSNTLGGCSIGDRTRVVRYRQLKRCNGLVGWIVAEVRVSACPTEMKRIKQEEEDGEK